MSDEYETATAPLVYTFRVGELSKLATISFIAGLMQHKVTQLRLNNGKGHDIYETRLIRIELPTTVSSDIECLSYEMQESRMKWWSYHYESVFSHRESPDCMIDLLPLLVWLPDCSISFVQTARNMLNCDKLTNMEKFMVACLYCFMNDVERLQLTLTEKELKDATSGHRRYGVPFLDYWHSKLHNWIDNLYLATWHINLLDRLISSLKHYDNWLAVEYFWNQLCENDPVQRVSKALDMINADRPALTWHLLSRLSSSEFNLVIVGKGLQIIQTLVKELKYLEHIISIWERMVNIIGDRVLADIILFVHEFQDASRCYLNPLLWEMWLCMSERQKKFIVDERICDFIQKSYNEDFDFCYRPNFHLILDVLLRFDSERRRQYWLQHWPYLVHGQLYHDRKYIEQIMRLCLANHEEIAAFKRTTMLSYEFISDYWEFEMSAGQFDELQRYLEFCTSDLEVIRHVKKQIITMMSKEDLFSVLFRTCDHRVNGFNKFVWDVFVQNEREEFMYEIVSHPNNLDELCDSLCGYGIVCNVASFVDKCLTADEHLLKVKLELFERCRRSDKIKRSKMRSLIAWCFNVDKQLVKQFRKLPPPIVEIELGNCNPGMSDGHFVPGLMNLALQYMGIRQTLTAYIFKTVHFYNFFVITSLKEN
ncbi:uncharacterized protein LOC135847938 [Planococcus citri]|uniref:uncharacterized protein LOC135847938 n=1 Tax=Planococcus citri TaxID=170843 RepID=UPI0031F815A1